MNHHANDSHDEPILRQSAILARCCSTLPDELANLVGQAHEAVRTAKRSSACSLSKLRVSSSRTISGILRLLFSGQRVGCTLPGELFDAWQKVFSKCLECRVEQVKGVLLHALSSPNQA
jgi:hypothetical protein